MAIGDVADFKIYHEEFFGGFSEALEQNTNIFNGASAGAIQLRPNRLKGYYEKESFVKNIANLIAERDPTDGDGTAADLAMTQDEFVGVKLNRRIGPVTNTLDSWRKIGEDAQTMSYTLGLQIGAAAAVEMTNSAVRALVAAIQALSTAALYDNTGTAGSTLDHVGLVKTMALMGDASSRVVAFLMHSKSYHDLMENTIGDAIYNVANVTIYNGSVASMGRPVIVTDSAPLIESTTDYNVLALTEAACIVDESEAQEIVNDVVTGKENLAIRVQGEYAYNLKIKGFRWDVASGGANPDATALALSTNWDFALTSGVNSIKGGPGARGLFL